MSKTPRYVVVEKKIGETPLARLELFRKTEPRLADVPITYAGRLDPMASGELLLLIGDECKKREKYTALDKSYEFEILLGASSDTGDVLGLPRLSEGAVFSDEEVESVRQMFIGKSRLPYPSFSSKTVDGKPLFQHALLGTLDDIEIPQKETEVYRLVFLGKKEISAGDLLHDIESKIEALKVDTESTRLGADFRKDEILARWRQLLSGSDLTFTLIKCEATVSSGTYIRTLAEKIGEQLGSHALAYAIHRTRIGRFLPIWRRLGLWTRVF